MAAPEKLRPEDEVLRAVAPIRHRPLRLGELRYQRVNERLAQINGKPVSKHIGRHFHEVIPEVAPRLEPVLRQILENGQPVLDLEVCGPSPTDPDGRRDWLCQLLPLDRRLRHGVGH